MEVSGGPYDPYDPTDPDVDPEYDITGLLVLGAGLGAFYLFSNRKKVKKGSK